MGLLNENVVVAATGFVYYLSGAGQGGRWTVHLGISTPMFLMECPSFHRAKCPSHVVPGLWSSAVALFKGGPASDVAIAREPPIQPESV